MRCSVKLLTAGVLALSAGSFPTGAQAGEVCFRLDPFSDILRLELGPVTDGHRNVYGTWILPGTYALPVSGAFEFDSGSTTVRRLGIVGTNATVFFDGHLICGLEGIQRQGFTIQCSGGDEPNLQSGGTLTPISCAGLSSSAAKVKDRGIGTK